MKTLPLTLSLLLATGAAFVHAGQDDPMRLEARGLVKQFGGDRADELWLDWNDLPDLPVEARLSQLCRWVLDADREQLRYGLRLPGVEQPVNSGPAQRARCLELLALFDSPAAA